MSRRNAFGHKTGRAGIKCYRAAGRMFGQTFNPGGGKMSVPKPRPTSPAKRAREYASYRRALAATAWTARREGTSNVDIRKFLASRGR